MLDAPSCRDRALLLASSCSATTKQCERVTVWEVITPKLTPFLKRDVVTLQQLATTVKTSAQGRYLAACVDFGVLDYWASRTPW